MNHYHITSPHNWIELKILMRRTTSISPSIATVLLDEFDRIEKLEPTEYKQIFNINVNRFRFSLHVNGTSKANDQVIQIEIDRTVGWCQIL